MTPERYVIGETDVERGRSRASDVRRTARADVRRHTEGNIGVHQDYERAVELSDVGCRVPCSLWRRGCGNWETE